MTGWLKTGSYGTLTHSMYDAFNTAQHVYDDMIKGIQLHSNSIRQDNIDTGRFLKDMKLNNIVTWRDWKRIDTHEIVQGTLNGKPREKLVHMDLLSNIIKED